MPINNTKKLFLFPQCFQDASRKVYTLPNKNSNVCYYHVTYEFQSESTLYSLPECQGTPCSTQAPYLKFK